MDDNTRVFLKEMGLIRSSTIEEEICERDLQLESLIEEQEDGKKYFLQVARKGLLVEMFYSDKIAWEEAIEFLKEQNKKGDSSEK